MDKKINCNFFLKDMKFKHLPEKDRYLYAEEAPKHRFNIIGAGNMGQEHMMVTMLEGSAAVHGVYDPSPAVAGFAAELFKSRFPDKTLTVFQTLEEACMDSKTDGLIICSPNYTHLEVLKTAMRSKKAILLEKPMATTLEDAAEIAKLAEHYENILQIGLQYRYKAMYAESIHEVLERRAVGSVKTITLLEHRMPFLDKINQWNKFNKYSGGTLVEKCCHYFDLLNLFAQSRPKTVYATGGMAVNFRDFVYDGEPSDILDNANVSIVYENGVRANFNLCMFSPMFYEEMVICGDEGRLKVFENEDYLPDQRPATHMEILCGEIRPTRICTPCYPETIQKSGHFGATYYEHRNFVRNMEGEKTNTATAWEGVWSIIVAIAAQQSIAAGEVISIDTLLREHGLWI